MSNSATITERIGSLRSLLKERRYAAAIVNTADPHLSEYIADHWKYREWLSGFTGSAGTLVVGLDWAGLWTDSRYYIQAAQQLEGTGITLYKEGLPETADIPTEIGSKLKAGDLVATDARLYSVAAFKKTSEALATKTIVVKHDEAIYKVWSDRPKQPSNAVFVHDLSYTGEPASHKLADIAQFAKKTGATACLISGLDEIAWTLNLRGSDISYNPVFYAYLSIDADTAKGKLYANNPSVGRDLEKDPIVSAALGECGVDILPYDQLEADLRGSNHKWCYDANCTNAFIEQIIGKNCVSTSTPTMHLKAVKNSVQIEGLRRAQTADGVAMVKAFCWLDQQLDKGEKVTELSFANHLDECRAQQQHFFSLSFNTISGFAHHGAIVHYGVTPETDIPLAKGNFLLVDSGGNYLDGTTDITRTVCLGGKPSEQQKRDYTLVLKGHIALATTPFPMGTSGAQLDTLARQFLWREAKNYGHGTGHGIGHFLCVHEGPQRISVRNNNIPLEPGMFLSNEPGLYIEGQYGIRIENMTCVKNCCESQFGKFFELETMSYFPFDAESIDTQLLSDDELRWINGYHKKTLELLSMSGLLNTREKEWLTNKTKALAK